MKNEVSNSLLYQPLDFENGIHISSFTLNEINKTFSLFPLYQIVRALLPGEQRTSVIVRPGRKMREALSKAMRLRNLHCQMCEIRTMDEKRIIPWDSDMSLLSGKEVKVLRVKRSKSADGRSKKQLASKTVDENWVSSAGVRERNGKL